MTTSALNFAPVESVPESEDGLIHGLSVEELQIVGTKCIDAKQTAYCPYSVFRVGASLLLRTPSPTSTPYNIITGANIENASYPVGICAERTAMSTAIHQGYKYGTFKAIGVATDMDDFCSPCGMCRQFLREFCEESVPVFMFNREGKWKVKTMGELLPESFGPNKLPDRESLRELLAAEKAKTA